MKWALSALPIMSPHFLLSHGIKFGIVSPHLLGYRNASPTVCLLPVLGCILLSPGRNHAKGGIDRVLRTPRQDPVRSLWIALAFCEVVFQGVG